MSQARRLWSQAAVPGSAARDPRAAAGVDSGGPAVWGRGDGPPLACSTGSPALRSDLLSTRDCVSAN